MLDQDGGDTRTTQKEQFETWFHLFLNQTPGKILVSIDPRFTDDEINGGIKAIKRKAVREIKAVGKEKQFSPRSCYPQQIGNYIGWLKKYDEIVYTARKMNFKVRAEGPILTLPEDFSFGLMVPKDKGDQFETVRKSFRNAYGKATDLIKISPYISFSNSRNQK